MVIAPAAWQEPRKISVSARNSVSRLQIPTSRVIAIACSIIRSKKYFKTTSDAHLKASKKIPLPTGKKIELEASPDATSNFFEVYDKYFGTLFTTITLPSGEDKTKYKTVDGVLELQLNTSTPEQIELLAQFLRDVKQYGISIKAPLIESTQGLVVDTDGDENFFKTEEHYTEEGILTTDWNLFRRRSEGGKIGIRPEQVYAVAQQLLKRKIISVVSWVWHLWQRRIVE